MYLLFIFRAHVEIDHCPGYTVFFVFTVIMNTLGLRFYLSRTSDKFFN